MNANTIPETNALGMALPDNTEKVADGLQPDNAGKLVSKVSITMSVGIMVIETFEDGSVAVNGDRVERSRGRSR